MYASLNRHDVKELNRLDKRRRIKYDEHRKGNRNAEELRTSRTEVEAPEGRYEDALTRTSNSHSSSYR